MKQGNREDYIQFEICKKKCTILIINRNFMNNIYFRKLSSKSSNRNIKSKVGKGFDLNLIKKIIHGFS